MEQLNIEGKRSGEGFVVHRDALVSALSRAQSPKVEVIDVTLGRRGFLAYLKALGGSNIVKVVPSPGDGASESQPAVKSLKVTCGPNTGHLGSDAWTTDKMVMAHPCQVRVSPNVAVVPNLGAWELAEALARVIPFVARGKEAEDNAIRGSVRFAASEGKLTLAGCDGYRVGILALDYADGEGEALIPADEIKGLVTALRRARRVRVSFNPDERGIAVETECIRYGFRGVAGTFPDYEKLIPTEFVAEARFDAREAAKAVASLSALSVDKGVGIRLAVHDGGVTLAVLEDTGQATIEAEASGEMVTGIDSRLFTDTLKALGGMAEVKLTGDVTSPILFTANGYRALVAPVKVPARPQAEGEGQAVEETPTQAEGETQEPDTQAEGEAQAQDTQAEGEAQAQDTQAEGDAASEKPRRHRRAREPVAA